MGNEHSSNSGSKIPKPVKDSYYKGKEQKNIGNIKDLHITNDIFVSEKSDKIVNEYKLLQTIGVGSYGEVRKVIHLQSNQIRAAKVLFKKQNKKDSLEKIQHEVNILKNLDHPNIMKIFECFQDEKNYYIITEFCSGGELFDMLKKKQVMSEQEACYITKQLLSAIHYMHNQGFIHRDIKPENILFLEDDVFSPIKLIDFGSSEQKQDHLCHRIGTPYYIAPEVLKRDYNQKCDLWSIGIVVYVLLCGYPPFNGPNDTIIFNKIMRGQFSMSNKDWSKISKEAKEFVKKLLEQDVNKRYNPQQAMKDPWILKFYPNYQDKVDTQVMKQYINNMTSFNYDKKLQQAVLMFLMNNYASNKEKLQLLELFRALDVNQDGILDKKEIKAACKNLQNFNSKQLDKIIQLADQNQDGLINYTEFLMASVNKEALVNESNLLQVFNQLDNDNKGSLNINDIKQLFGRIDDKLVESDVWQDIMKEVDTNNDGNISFEEFKNMMHEFKRRDSQNQINDYKGQNQLVTQVYDIDEEPLVERMFGQVRRCVNKKTGKHNAIYILNKRLFTYENLQELKNYIVNQKLRDVNNLKINLYEIFTDQQCYYLIIDEYFGCDINDYLKAQINFDEHKLAKISKSILEILFESHNMNLYHLKLNPENIFFPKLMKQSQPKIFYEIFSEECNVNLGTQFNPYKAPELYQNKSVYSSNEDEEQYMHSDMSDMYSLGIILYCFAMGQTPYSSKKDLLTQNIDLNHSEFGMFSQEFKQFLGKLLQKDPKQRLTTIQAINDPWIRKFANFNKKLPSLVKNIRKYEEFQAKQNFINQIHLYFINNSILDDSIEQMHNYYSAFDSEFITLEQFTTGIKDILNIIDFQQELDKIYSNTEIYDKQNDKIFHKQWLELYEDKQRLFLTSKIDMAFFQFTNNSNMLIKIDIIGEIFGNINQQILKLIGTYFQGRDEISYAELKYLLEKVKGNIRVEYQKNKERSYSFNTKIKNKKKQFQQEKSKFNKSIQQEDNNSVSSGYSNNGENDNTDSDEDPITKDVNGLIIGDQSTLKQSELMLHIINEESDQHTDEAVTPIQSDQEQDKLQQNNTQKNENNQEDQKQQQQNNQNQQLIEEFKISEELNYQIHIHQPNGISQDIQIIHQE